MWMTLFAASIYLFGFYYAWFSSGSFCFFVELNRSFRAGIHAFYFVFMCRNFIRALVLAVWTLSLSPSLDAVAKEMSRDRRHSKRRLIEMTRSKKRTACQRATVHSFMGTSPSILHRCETSIPRMCCNTPCSSKKNGRMLNLLVKSLEICFVSSTLNYDHQFSVISNEVRATNGFPPLLHCDIFGKYVGVSLMRH